ncbi:hypothetical protein [Streptomyces sp. NPDC090445]|uniref:hypothetical protein n=1 Tax=Streptomyces sp. NPDC090445 TaxID=3365963 RepID=UPI00382AEA6B
MFDEIHDVTEHVLEVVQDLGDQIELGLDALADSLESLGVLPCADAYDIDPASLTAADASDDYLTGLQVEPPTGMDPAVLSGMVQSVIYTQSQIVANIDPLASSPYPPF